eukprot:6614517-Prorocentrum_lima.AAC.1
MLCVSCCRCGECASHICHTSCASSSCGGSVCPLTAGPRARCVAAATVGSSSMAQESFNAF